ncbi:hypothetical protein [Desulfofustis glycolicus]|uniref:Uncharacterized protein n=1 Tax=Desulfofustis glycolicus DSM 9705 TaxID=1121409 RepID=A0A1M5YM38_9BACT|nr:hypothetical protein [Desulfofustis glycolicus]SHI13031.1 hypothetical protein SAMN02745124_04206 [Desulfofustis glycolicus DSM 9705]
MNNLYRMELMQMLSDLDSYLEELFSHTGFYESDKLSKKDFKIQIIEDYQEIYLEKHK